MKEAVATTASFFVIKIQKKEIQYRTLCIQQKINLIQQIQTTTFQPFKYRYKNKIEIISKNITLSVVKTINFVYF